MQKLLDLLTIMTITGNKVTLNKRARDEFKSEENIMYLLKHIALHKEQSFIEIGGFLYLINIIIKESHKYLIFTKVIENLPKSFINNAPSEDTDMLLCSKSVFKSFVEKFIALKQRYGGFEMKLIYIKIKVDLEKNGKDKILETIGNHIIKVTRKSDIIGKFRKNEFGMILPNIHSDGIKIILNKIFTIIEIIKENNPKLKIDMYESTINQTFIMQSMDNFNKALEKAESDSILITKD